jgi:hypothetical protein
MMRAVELIGCEVVDRDGTRVGRVCDLRLVADPHGRGLSGYHLESLVTRTGPLGDRLGVIRLRAVVGVPCKAGQRR